MTIIRRTGARIALAVAVLAALAIGAAGASAAPGSIRALDLSAPSLGARVEVAAPGGGTFNADPGRALVRVSPAGGTATQVLAWCVDPAHYISEGVDYPVDLQTPADTPELAGPGYAQAGWLIASSERMIADAADPGLEAAAIQVAVWQITGTAADTANVTTSAALNARVAQIRALAAGRTIVTALELSAPAAAVDVGAPVTVTVSGTPGAVVDLAVTSGAATLSSAQVVVAPSGTVAVSLTPSAAGPVVVAASAQGGTLHRAARLAGAPHAAVDGLRHPGHAERLRGDHRRGARSDAAGRAGPAAGRRDGARLRRPGPRHAAPRQEGARAGPPGR